MMPHPENPVPASESMTILPNAQNNIYEIALVPENTYAFILTINNNTVEELISEPSKNNKYRKNYTLHFNNTSSMPVKQNIVNSAIQPLVQSVPMAYSLGGVPAENYITHAGFQVNGVYYTIPVNLYRSEWFNYTSPPTLITTYQVSGHAYWLPMSYDPWHVEDVLDMPTPPPNDAKYRYSLVPPKNYQKSGTITSVDINPGNYTVEINRSQNYYYPIGMTIVGPGFLGDVSPSWYGGSGITWSSSNPEVGTVMTDWWHYREYFNPGKPGTTTITATYNGGTATNSVTFHVVSNKITISPTKATIYVHHTDPAKKQQQFTASNGSQNITRQVTWSTSDTNIATISNFDIHKGLAFAGSKAGTVTVSAVDSAGTKADPSAELHVECVEYAKHKQDKGIWRNTPLGHYGQVIKRTAANLPDPPFAPLNSIGAWGCALTVIADIVGKTPLDVNSTLINPTTPKKAQFYGTAQIDWTTMVDYLSNNTITYETGNIPAINDSGFVNQDPYNISIIDTYLNLCKTVVIGIHGGPYPPNINSYPHHYLIVLSKNPDGTYNVFDPAVLSSIQTLPANQEIYAHMVYNHNY